MVSVQKFSMNTPFQLSDVLRSTLSYLEEDLLLQDVDCGASIGSISGDIFDTDNKGTQPTAQSFSSVALFPTSGYLEGYPGARSSSAADGSWYTGAKSARGAPSMNSTSLVALMTNRDMSTYSSLPWDPQQLVSSPGFALEKSRPVVTLPRTPVVTAPHRDRASEALLHKLCYAYKPLNEKSENSLIRMTRQILEKDPEAIIRPHAVHTKRAVWNTRAQKKIERRVQSDYVYPLHIALANKEVPLPVLRELLNAATQLTNSGSADALTLADGPQLEIPLMVLIKVRTEQVKLMDEFLLAAPASVGLLDRRNNSALHLAAYHGANLVVVRHLVILEPQNCYFRNMLQQTPLKIAEQRSNVDISVLNFLQARSYRYGSRIEID